MYVLEAAVRNEAGAVYVLDDREPGRTSLPVPDWDAAARGP